MNHIQYRVLYKCFVLELKHVESVKWMDAFRRVKKGEGFSNEDIQLVAGYYAKHESRNFRMEQSSRLSMEDSITTLDFEVSGQKEGLASVQKKLKVNGINLDLIRRQIRLKVQKERVNIAI
ncbi:hypothetical protein H7992_05105 [Sporosarcina sp. resist]|uniref:hypothetical protein n=1 Tax=Sporosarcina sp. resist TaxID=2762563 RepID=UPI00164D8491|nr:hypothetical protein [Sporosarcina sp. resist]QNK89104.1 hypothetical protein H7992_05105 [Sporosarcina sp. resist]